MPDRVRERISYPVLNVFLGTSQKSVGENLRERYNTLVPEDQRKVAQMFIDTMGFGRMNNSNNHNGPAQPTRRGMAAPRPDTYLNVGVPAAARIAIQNHPVNTKDYLVIYYYGTSTRPMRAHIPATTAAGAGGLRNNGHGAFWFCVHNVKQALESALDDITAPTVTGDHPATGQYVIVNICCFAGGGSGSGMLPSLVLLLRSILDARGVEGGIFVYITFPERAIGPHLNHAKANTLALLLELLALSMQVGGDTPYKQPLYQLQLSIDAQRLVDRIFLYGRTGLDQPEAARLVANDLWMRSLTAEGVGQRELNELPNVGIVTRHDDRGLPTLFSSSCPLEVTYPVQRVAEGFAYRLSRKLIARLCEGYEPDPTLRGQRRQRDDQKAKDFANMLERSLNPQEAGQPFADGEFGVAIRTPAALDTNWQRMQNRAENPEVIQEIQAKRGAKEAELVETLRRHLSQATTLVEVLTLLETTRDSYAQSLSDINLQLTRIPADNPFNERQNERRFLEPNYSKTELSQKMRVYITTHINQALVRRIRRRVLTEAASLLNQIIVSLDKNIERLNKTIPALIDYSLSSNGDETNIPEMDMGLSESTPYSRSALFLEATDKEQYGDVLPVDKLYSHVARMFVAKLPDGSPNGKLLDTVMPDFTRWMAERGRGPLIEATRDKVRDWTTEFWREVIISELERINVVELIYNYLNDGRDDEEHFLEKHLAWLASRIQPMVDRTPEVANLETGTAGNSLEWSLHVSVPLDGARPEAYEVVKHQEFNVGTLRVEPKYIETELCDPRSIHVLYSEHGISLAAIPSFYRADGDTYLATLLERLDRMQADFTENPFSCEAMRRLVIDELELTEKIRR